MVTVTTAIAEKTNTAVRRVDFDHTELCAYCNPVTCTLKGEKVPVGNWRDLLMALISKFTTEMPEKINELHNRPLLTRSSRPFLLKDKPNGSAKQTATGHWVYVDLNISVLVDLIGKLCRYCGVNLNDVEITYTPKSSHRSSKDMERDRNDGSAFYAEQGVRAEFRAWLTEQHPDWSPHTITMHCSDAYYLYDNDRGITLIEALNADDGEQRAFAAIERYLSDDPTQTNKPSVSAAGYLRSLQMLKVFLTERSELLKGGVATASNAAMESIIRVLTEDYVNGFRFGTTTLRLLSEKAQVDIDDKLQSKLKHLMFRRNDDVYFLPDVICNTETRTAITDRANYWLDDYGCFEISELYDLFINNINSCCIDSLENFQAFYQFINCRDVRCVECYKTRIARINRGVSDLSTDIATQIISIVHEEFGGTINEDDLRVRFRAFSAHMLASIIKEHAKELVKTEINGMVCYQTLGALGLSDEFSDTLAEVLEQISDIGLAPSEEVLHTALSINLGVNFKVEYNIPDDKTYRRLIETYYKNVPKRKWLRGIFAEVPD